MWGFLSSLGATAHPSAGLRWLGSVRWCNTTSLEPTLSNSSVSSWAKHQQKEKRQHWNLDRESELLGKVRHKAKFNLLQ
jgi:hypothetical protein